MTPKEILKRLFQYARPYAGYLIGGLLCAVASIALTLLGPVLIGKAIDQIVGPGQVKFSRDVKISDPAGDHRGFGGGVPVADDIMYQ